MWLGVGCMLGCNITFSSFSLFHRIDFIVLIYTFEPFMYDLLSHGKMKPYVFLMSMSAINLQRFMHYGKFSLWAKSSIRLAVAACFMLFKQLTTSFVVFYTANLHSLLNAEIGDSNIWAEHLKIKHKDDSNLRTNPHLYCRDNVQKVCKRYLYSRFCEM